MSDAIAHFDSPDSASILDDLAACQSPVLIGVRHHSAVMARVMPQMLQSARPERILLELPPEFSDWLTWLAHPDTTAPVALAGCREAGADLCFYPFADFSPELAAIRWAAKNGVPIEPFDLPVACRETAFVRAESEPRGLLRVLMNRMQVSDTGALWDRLIEARGTNASAEELRRAALLFGWALRWNDSEASEYDRRREAFMRSRIEANSDQRCVAVIGSYHAAALLPTPLLWKNTPVPDAADETIATALIPYAFEHLDERSGYPAGIRDPMWHQRIFESHDANAIDHAMVDLVVGVCRELRQHNHPMNAADAQEVVRVSRDLARLRNLPAPGRQEVIEALQLCLTQGQIYGAGRMVAAAMQIILVGERRGELSEDVPRSGLAPHVEQILQDLRLPGPDSLGEEKRMRLDPLRSALDRAREVVFQQLLVCGIPYTTPAEDGSAADRESLTTVWTVKWEHSTAAMISLSSIKGATLAQVAAGILQHKFVDDVSDWNAQQLASLHKAAECGFESLVLKGLDWILGPFADSATLPELTSAMTFIEKVSSRHFAGLPAADDKILPAFNQVFDVPSGLSNTALLQAAIARVNGLQGSEEQSDVVAILDLILWFQQQTEHDALDLSRLVWSLKQLWHVGSPLMQGAGVASLLLVSEISTEAFCEETGSWLDTASTSDARRQLKQRLQSMTFVAQPRILSDLSCLDGLDGRIDSFTDAEFMERLPALRRGFHLLSVAAKRSLLRQLTHRWPNDDRQLNSTTHDQRDPEIQQMWFQADEAARLAVADLMPDFDLNVNVADLPADTHQPHSISDIRRELSQSDRWHLVLGQHSSSMCRSASTAARALDELYGAGEGEGSRDRMDLDRGGDQPAYPSAREWADDLEELFGESVREEVLAEAVEAGRSSALTLLDEDSIRPSVELLEQVLSLKGGLPEAHTEKLRRIAKRITEQLAKELATKMAPVLTGLATPRPTRRRSRRLDLRRTVLANLHTARVDSAGEIRLCPEDFFFKTPAKRSMDWHIVYVVDVSGSMEPSVIYSALTAAIFSGLPALSVSFLAFSTEIVDFTNTVEDPLAMLMEVQVGGGTYIWKGIRAARETMKVPARTIVLLITDFEEGAPIGRLLSEVRALVDTGAKALGLAALGDDGKPRYHNGIAAQVAGCGMPVAALTPNELARWVGEQIQ